MALAMSFGAAISDVQIFSVSCRPQRLGDAFNWVWMTRLSGF